MEIMNTNIQKHDALIRSKSVQIEFANLCDGFMRSSRMRAILLILIIMASVCSAQMSGTVFLKAAQAAGSEQSGNSEMLTLNFRDADIRTILRFFGEQTGKTVVVDERVKGKATLVSPGSVTQSDALKALESVLAALDLSMIRDGAIYKVMPSSRVKDEPVTVSTETSPSYGETASDPVSHVIYLKSASAAAVKTALAPLLSRQGNISALDSSNCLIITDRGGSVERVARMARILDESGPDATLKVFELKHVEPSRIASQITTALTASMAGKGTAPVITAVDTRNAIIATGKTDSIATVAHLVRELDRESTGRLPEARVIEIQNASVEQVAALLKDQFLSPKGLLASDQWTLARTNVTFDSRLKLLILTSSSRGALEKMEKMVSTLDAVRTPEKSRVHVIRLQNSSAENLVAVLADLFGANTNSSASEKQLPNDSITMVAEKSTNSIIVTASTEKFQEISQTIAKLDVFRTQVLVEVLIAEVSLGDIREVGAELGFMQPDSTGNQAIGGTSFGLKEGMTTSGGLNTGIVKGNPDLDKIASGSLSELSRIRAIIHAYQNSNTFKILSTPRILTCDNEPASIVVGEVVALPQGFARDVDTGRFDLTKFEYADVGINLKITPRINTGSMVTLNVDVETRARQDENLYQFNIPVLTKRAAKTTVTIQDTQTVVIGGLIREDKQKVVSKVPVLGDIPLLGKLFRSRKTVRKKTNLLIFITPHIIDTREDAGAITSDIADEAAGQENDSTGTFRKIARKLKGSTSNDSISQ
ncbi:MAG: hypothetical protein CVV64_09405 [Candidatus Wallbacteria bacterium HGW-Wallbacteria-1]|jgi:general secretion pathway protein D|uniref:Type II secretion system protein GspD n=1 Tax=Candidatus Wallbacteria bacterium HGW-Wallbacteria-1 TaxID=2013854 RepID=A0A2N1PQF7_9BACT|nr:MAG: hypothetical protein CVV64_09405 [Candidatus Wallbacteria bacterium HGW-Wallbacteria-1]